MQTTIPTALTRLAARFALLVALWLIAAVPGAAEDRDILRFDVADMIDSLAIELSEGARQGRLTLESLDSNARAAVTEINSGRDYEHAAFSARTQTVAMYNMAEAFEPGEGNRFIAKLHRHLSGSSAILQLDPGLQEIRRGFTDADLNEPLGFVQARSMTPEALARPLPGNIEAAVELLARTMAPGGLGSMTSIMQRHLRLDRAGETAQRVIDRAILTSSSRKGAIRRVVNAHTPPPDLRRAMRSLLLDVASRSAALDMDDALRRVLRDLGEESLPPRLSNIAETGDRLESRQMQRSAVPGGGGISMLPGEEAARSDISRIIEQGGVEASATDAPGRFPESGPSYDGNRRAHSTYVRRTFSEGVPREFSRAIRSPRAARGIAIGAELRMPEARPSGAFWVPAVADDRFGRLAVQVPGSDRLAVTRYLFADSFEAAVSMLWGDHGAAAAYRASELNIVVSMDPDFEVANDERDRVLALAEEPPRGVVVHPALHGRELAWSAVRVDFWFNDPVRLGREGERISGNAPPVMAMAGVIAGSAQTWQFHERDSRIEIAEGFGPTDSLRILSPGPEHFGVTLFAFSDTPPGSAAEPVGDDTWLLPNERKQVQPLVDWALNNHPDFMRLNDFAEALSVLRWLDRAGTRLVVLDPDGQAGRIVTPDRVWIEEVAPAVGK